MYEAAIIENGEVLDVTHEEAFMLRDRVYRCEECGDGVYHVAPDESIETVEALIHAIRMPMPV